MPIAKELLDEVALSQQEYDLLVQRLGREPTPVELGMAGSLWSEHCGYKHSKLLLKLLPSRSRRLLVGPGAENAGVVDIGGGLAIAMKMESHNHPSAIEPYQGAATGVGGIVRDIFAMGARPVALMNSLRFGPLSQPRQRHLFNGVVGGIAGYGNCLGIPDVAGEIHFSETYAQNPLVNAFCLGILEEGKMQRALAATPGNLLMLVGADTGRDGIHGASGLASRSLEEDKELRSAVQVGNPFLEKLLMEACLELAGTDWIEGLQDLGAAGLTSAAVECAARGGAGIDVDVARVPRREQGMTPYEVMLSESQERMLVVVKKGSEDKVKGLFQRWDLRCDVIGRVTADGLARIRDNGNVVAEAPVSILNEPPLYRYQPGKPAWLTRLQKQDLTRLPDLSSSRCGDILLKLLASPGIASKESVYRQYDHQVLTNTVVLPGADAAVLRLKGTKKGIALASDGNGRYCYLDPYAGAAIVVAEAARNLSCVGASPLALTDCLNFGNPEKPDVYYQLKECVRGLARACRALGVPVMSGNVSLYNETEGRDIYPTPVVGMAGLLADVARHCTTGFKGRGDVVYVLGPVDAPAGQSLAGSEYLELVHGLVAGRPAIDLGMERRVQRACRRAIRRGLLRSAHDCSDGGLAVALAECCILGDIGLVANIACPERKDACLFGEQQSRIVVSVRPGDAAALEALAAQQRVPLGRLGEVGGNRLRLGHDASTGSAYHIDLPVAELGSAWRGGLERALA